MVNNTKNLVEFIKEVYQNIVSIPAISPLSGGRGEMKKAKYIEGVLKGFGVKVSWYNAKEGEIIHPNLVGIYNGVDTSKTFWIISHMDVVPEGDKKLWHSDPFSAVVKKDRIYGRGTEDNGQGIVLALALLRYFVSKKLKPRINLGLVFVSDEETGSKYGMQFLVQKHKLFNPKDIAFVPDWGSKDGSKIEVAEKHVLWIKATVHGKQTHASTPQKGINACKEGMLFYLKLYNDLYKKFRMQEKLFDVPFSTFEPTKRAANVPNINTIPAEDVQYFDCRIIPEYNVDAVLQAIRKTAKAFEASSKCKIDIEIISRDDSPPIDLKAAKDFSKSIEKVRRIKPRFVGIGGGTVAKYTRELGISTIVWSTLDDMAHSPNEYVKISNIVKDLQVLIDYLTSSHE
ncbi:MAG: M20 family metallo-hydrolase [Candidatus Micrarchaeia archaeon]